MAYQKKYATEEERHAARVEIGRAAGKKSGENRRRNPKSPSERKVQPAFMVRVRQEDKIVIDAMAKHMSITVTELMHQVAETLKQKYPQAVEAE